MAKYAGLLLRILDQDGPAFGPGRAQLITAIDAHGSISAAARSLGMSYRRAWQLIESVNACFVEPVVITETGGRRGGGARVTPFGRDLVERYRGMERKASASIRSEITALEQRLKSGFHSKSQ